MVHRDEQLHRFIRRLAEASGRIIQPCFLSPRLRVESKPDNTLVTEADRQAEEVLREMIRKDYPQHGIVGEEFGAENQEAEFVWVLDPIDGTISFVHGCPLFGTLIGLLHRGQPVLGAIHQPIVNLLCVGDNQTTTLNERPVRMREIESLGEATLLVTDALAVGSYQNQAGFENLMNQAGLFRTWGDCWGYLLLAAGRADIMLDPIMKPWDLLPLIPVIQGAGGVITAWDGSAAVGADSCVAAGKKLHPLVLETLNG